MAQGSRRSCSPFGRLAKLEQDLRKASRHYRAGPGLALLSIPGDAGRTAPRSYPIETPNRSGRRGRDGGTWKERERERKVRNPDDRELLCFVLIVMPHPAHLHPARHGSSQLTYVATPARPHDDLREHLAPLGALPTPA